MQQTNTKNTLVNPYHSAIKVGGQYHLFKDKQQVIPKVLMNSFLFQVEKTFNFIYHNQK